MTRTTETQIIVYVGTYTRKGSQGIYVFRFDPVTGSLSPVGSAPADNPSFLAIHPNKQVLYAVNEVGEFGGAATGAVSAFAIDWGSGALTLLNQQPSHGQAPAHIAVDRAGAYVYVANYSSGTAAVFPIQVDGSLGTASDVVQHVGSGPDPRRQREPHAHSINLDFGDRRAYVADLGTDKVMIYDVASEPGKLRTNIPASAQVDGGSGPRHLAFHPSGRYAYLINEMGNTITAFAYNPVDGGLSALQTVPTLPADFDGRSTTADIHVAPSGAFLYGSNRGHDSIVVYRIDNETGGLSYVQHASTEGRTPRNFAIDPTGTYLLAANQDSDSLVVFRIDPDTGMLSATGTQVMVSMPVCVSFVVR
ncbi:MAG: lactonase family protein [Anaerolineae bacterium]|nr:lactonase family protein [Anaerolineae bacterium]